MTRKIEYIYYLFSLVIIGRSLLKIEVTNQGHIVRNLPAN